MSKRGFLVLAIGIFVMVTWRPAAADIIIRIWLFQGAWMESEPRLNQIEILSASSHPEFSRLKDMVSGPISEFSAAATETLLDIKKLRTLDELFLSEKTWDEDRPRYSPPSWTTHPNRGLLRRRDVERH